MIGISKNDFCPNGIVTRAQLAQVLFNLAGKPDSEQGDPFLDMQNHWAEGAVRWAYATGITEGTSESRFSPESKVTREQVAAMFCRYWQREALVQFQPDPRDLEKFIDQSQISNWAKSSTCWALKTGLIQGTANQVLSPRGVCTRAQLAQILKNYCEKVAGYSEQYAPLGYKVAASGHITTGYGTDITGVDGKVTVLEQYIIEGINRYRVQCGKSALKSSTKAQLAAEIRAKEVVPIYSYYMKGTVPEWLSKDYRKQIVHSRFPWRPLEEFSGLGEYQEYMDSVQTASGTVYSIVNPLGDEFDRITRAAECALCSWDRSWSNPRAQADYYVSCWINSEGHRLSLLTEGIEYIGVGTTYDPGHKFYTCVFVAYGE